MSRFARPVRPYNWGTATLYSSRVLRAKKNWEAIHASEGGKPKAEWSSHNRRRAREFHETANEYRQKLTNIGWADMAEVLLANNYATSKIIVRSMITRAQNAAQTGVPERPSVPDRPRDPAPDPDVPAPDFDFPEIPGLEIIKKYVPWIIAGIIGLKILRRF